MFGYLPLLIRVASKICLHRLRGGGIILSSQLYNKFTAKYVGESLSVFAKIEAKYSGTVSPDTVYI